MRIGRRRGEKTASSLAALGRAAEASYTVGQHGIEWQREQRIRRPRGPSSYIVHALNGTSAVSFLRPLTRFRTSGTKDTDCIVRKAPKLGPRKLGDQ
jgi:hypothetical protein